MAEAVADSKTTDQAQTSRVSLRVLAFLILLAALAVFGAPTIVLLLVAGILVLLIAWRYTQLTFYAWIATATLLSWTVFINTGLYRIGNRVIGGTLEIGVAELIVAALIIAWALRAFFLWLTGKRQREVFLPLLGAYGLLVLAHALSVFSPAHPDVIGVLKYTLRPVLWVYVISVILPVNFIRSRRQLAVVLGILTVVGLIFSFDGLRSLWFGSDDQTLLARAHPLLIFGRYWIGDNHNVLAELLAFTAPVALALASLWRRRTIQRWLYGAAAFMALIALLTFARSAWIAIVVEMMLLFATIWRPWLKRHIGLFVFAALACAPLVAYMVLFVGQAGVQSSTDSRVMLASIAYDLFRGSPIFGVGAGTFVYRVSQVWLFTYEYGAPLDSHGILQKLLAETGILGILAFGYYLLSLVRSFWNKLRSWSKPVLAERQVTMYLLAGVLGAFIYQLFNTTYWTPKLWLPVGIALAAFTVFQGHEYG